MRFGLEVIKKVREAVGNDLAIGIRVSGNDFMEGGLTNPDVSFSARRRKGRHPCCQCHRRLARNECSQLTSDVPPGPMPIWQGGSRTGWVFLSLPQSAGRSVMAEKVLRSGAADMICVARPLLPIRTSPESQRGPGG